MKEKASIREQMDRKILILDGAMGTMLQQSGLTPADFGGEEYDGCNEHLVLTRPDVIQGIHEAYLKLAPTSLKRILLERLASFFLNIIWNTKQVRSI